MTMLPILHLILFPLIIHQTTSFASAVDPTQGFTQLPLGNSNFQIQKPYDVSVNERYSFSNGVHKFWIYPTDKPFMSGSNTQPRTEIRITGYDYTSGVWQFEGSGYVPSGTSGVCVMQVFGGSSTATTSQLRVYDGSLTYYKSPVLSPNIYNRWFKVNAIHDVGANNVKIYIDGNLKYNGDGRGAGTHYFKIGVYVQNDPSSYMESRWRDMKVFKK
ncbi:citrate-binding protein-like [Vicia villosa]|uniref:citrate-binding protein-like n=1 Tax=Vicia villosa TaxID=3911 RepID=UPI00273B7320|nr:citrate-binding protein-like [Vicia villosa]